MKKALHSQSSSSASRSSYSATLPLGASIKGCIFVCYDDGIYCPEFTSAIDFHSLLLYNPVFDS